MQFKKVLVDPKGNIVNKVKASPLPPDVTPKAPSVRIYTPDELLYPATRVSRKSLPPNDLPSTKPGIPILPKALNPTRGRHAHPVALPLVEHLATEVVPGAWCQSRGECP